MQPQVSVTISPFVSEAISARRYFVSGTVQGVGFRYFAQGMAQQLRVSGYVRNLPDGRVEAYAVGTPAQLARFRAALERGPHGSSVSEVREESAPVDARYTTDFVVTFA
jgi:acylphosphatase